MANPFYLAMTATEFQCCSQFPNHVAWMACHFSPYSQGLSNCPDSLPPGSLLILNDRIPPQGHDAGLIAAQLQELLETVQPEGILLDFQRQSDSEIRQITERIVSTLPCPIAVTAQYAEDLDCAVFLPPPPVRTPPSEYFAPWNRREIWMEVYDQWEIAAITQESCSISEEIPKDISELPHFDEALCCRYAIMPLEDRVLFYLHRGAEQLLSLPHPIFKFVGLYQEYGKQTRPA